MAGPLYGGGIGSGNGGIDYSTTEQWSGLLWVDGKKIYQTTIDLGELRRSSDGSALYYGIAHNIINLDASIHLWGFAYDPTKGIYMALPYGDPNAFIVIYLDPANVNIGTNRMDVHGIFDGIATLQYTCIDR